MLEERRQESIRTTSSGDGVLVNIGLTAISSVWLAPPAHVTSGNICSEDMRHYTGSSLLRLSRVKNTPALVLFFMLKIESIKM